MTFREHVAALLYAADTVGPMTLEEYARGSALAAQTLADACCKEWGHDTPFASHCARCGVQHKPRSTWHCARCGAMHESRST